MRDTQAIFALALAAFWIIGMCSLWRQPVHLDRIEPVSLDYRIDVNTADYAALQLLPRIGPRIAGNILDARRDGERFEAPGDLQRVSQIGSYTVEMISPWISFDSDRESRLGDDPPSHKRDERYIVP